MGTIGFQQVSRTAPASAGTEDAWLFPDETRCFAVPVETIPGLDVLYDIPILLRRLMFITLVAPLASLGLAVPGGGGLTAFVSPRSGGQVGPNDPGSPLDPGRPPRRWL
jgi:hypothetical protein